MKYLLVICWLGLACMGENYAQSKVWQGTWNTDFGIIRLQQDGNKIFGDYATRGLLDGAVGGQNLIRGEFTNNGKIGQFAFTIASDGKSFSGKWWWEGQAQNQGTWNGKLLNATKPELSTHFWTGNYVFHLPQVSSSRNRERKLSVTQRGLVLEGEFEDGKKFSARLNPDLNSLSRGHFYLGDKKFFIDGKTANLNKNTTWQGDYWTNPNYKQSYIVNRAGAQNLGSFKSKTY